MGDHNVPNSLLFIDKYSQIYRILLPICNALSQIDGLAAKPAIRSYIDDEFGSPDNLRREILCDFFRHGFDGSGGAFGLLRLPICLLSIFFLFLFVRRRRISFNNSTDELFAADNYMDAGSCIDGRLTSAWNWCSTLEKKRYFHVFLLSGLYPFLAFPARDSFVRANQASRALTANGSIGHLNWHWHIHLDFRLVDMIHARITRAHLLAKASFRFSFDSLL